MKNRILCLLLVFALMLGICGMLASCGGDNGGEEEIPVNPEGEAAFTALIEEFEQMGYTVDWEALEPFFLKGARRVILLNDGEVVLNVFIYSSSETSAEDASYFTEDGVNYVSDEASIEIAWTYDPHLFLHEQMIILYVGEEPSGVELCTEMFGEQFAGTPVTAE